MREEMLDYYFGGKTFVVEASFYQAYVGGLYPLPTANIPLSWVRSIKRLLVLTVIDRWSSTHRITDLRTLQAMTGLRGVQVVASLRSQPSLLSGASLSKGEAMSPALIETKAIRGLSVILAIKESIPVEAQLTFEIDSDLHSQIRRELSSSVDYILEGAQAFEDLLQEYQAALNGLSQSPGILSGDAASHEGCVYPFCTGRSGSCVNSRLVPWSNLTKANRRASGRW